LNPVAYKVLTSTEMATFQADGLFAGSPADLADGFIHLSTAEQLPGTLEKHYAGQTGLFIVAVDLAALGSAIRWEPSRAGQLFPHIYGALPISAALAHGPLTYAEDGAVRLPG
jgi:uncharacterized protein (DUF952 family)